VNPLRLLLDQMIDEDSAKKLRSEGYDAVRVSEIGVATADDDEILARAIEEKRVLVTLDGHFGDWVILPLTQHSGVIRIKAEPTTTANILAVLLPFLNHSKDRDFTNKLVIVKRSGVRWVETGIR